MARVMIIDENRLYGEMSREILRQNGHVAEWASDASRGMEMLRAIRFDLIILDLGFKNPDGYMLLSLIKSEPAIKSVPVLALAMKESDEDRKKVLALGAAQWAEKRVCTPVKLIALVKNMTGAL